MSGASFLSFLVLVGAVLGLCWLARHTWQLGADRLAQQRADSDELERWRVAMTQYERWLAEFPAVAMVLGSLRAEAAGQQLSMSASTDGPYTVDALRDRLRTGIVAQEVLRPFVRKAVERVFESSAALLADPVIPRCGGTIQTAKGHYFDFLAPERSVFDVEVIATALSKICRFTGHCKQFYSVAQHAVLVSYAVPEEFAFEGLHHDDGEAFVNDISKPLKEHLPDYQRFEARVQAAVFARLGIADKLPACVKEADLVLLATEQRDLMPPEMIVTEWREGGVGEALTPIAWEPAMERHPWWTLRGIKPLAAPIHPWGPEEAERQFLRRHYELLALRQVRAEKARAA